METRKRQINYQDYLLDKLMEECAEVIQEASKALLFGLDDLHPKHATTNAEQLRVEVVDLLVVLQELEESGWGFNISEIENKAKIAKLKKYYIYHCEMKVK